MKKHGLVIHTPTNDEKEQWKQFIQTWYPFIRGAYVPEEIFDKMMKLKEERINMPKMKSKPR